MTFQTIPDCSEKRLKCFRTISECPVHVFLVQYVNRKSPTIPRYIYCTVHSRTLVFIGILSNTMSAQAWLVH